MNERDLARSTALRQAWGGFAVKKVAVDTAHALVTEPCPSHAATPCDCRVKRLGVAIAELQTAYLVVLEAERGQ